MIPHSEYERLALLKEIECGDKVVLPTSMEHAKFMLMVAQAYINEHHQALMDAIKYSDKRIREDIAKVEV
jgi:hypothetical protein